MPSSKSDRPAFDPEKPYAAVVVELLAANPRCPAAAMLNSVTMRQLHDGELYTSNNPDEAEEAGTQYSCMGFASCGYCRSTEQYEPNSYVVIKGSYLFSFTDALCSSLKAPPISLQDAVIKPVGLSAGFVVTTKLGDKFFFGATEMDYVNWIEQCEKAGTQAMVRRSVLGLI